MGIIVYFTVLIALLLFPKNRILLWLSFVYLWIVYFACTYTYDLDIYIDRYYFYDDWFAKITEPLYTSTMGFFHFLHMKFIHVQMTISFLFLSSLFYFIIRTTKLQCFVIAMILISSYSFLVDLQRSCYAFVFCFPAFLVLLNDHNPIRRTIVYVALILIATTIHAMCIVYLLFIPIGILDHRKIVNSTVVLLLLGVLFIGIIDYLIPELANLMGMADKEASTRESMEAAKNRTVTYILAFLRCASVISLPLGIEYILKWKNMLYKLSSVDKKIIDMNIALISILPYLYLSHDLFRLFFVISIINYCFASRHLYDKWLFAYTIVCAINMAYWFMWRPYFMDMFWNIYLDNSIIKI